MTARSGAAPARTRPPARAGRAAMPHEVRIIGGQWKRSKLPVLDAPGLRPTADRVRETLFNWLGPTLEGWRCLDAFAGSGALGFEAASRGASEVVLLEREPRLVASLLATKARLQAETVRIERAEAIGWLARAGAASFDLVFVDPPFDSSLAAPALQAAARLLVAGGFVYVEAGSTIEAVATAAPSLQPYRSSRAGSVHFGLFTKPAA